MKTEFCSQPLTGYKKSIFSFLSTLGILLFSSSIYAHTTYHEIVMDAVRITPPTGSDYLAYKMVKHCTYEDDPGHTFDSVPSDSVCDDRPGEEENITSRYNTIDATMPGPTIVITEQDIAYIQLRYLLGTTGNPAPGDPPLTDPTSHVSLHVHGVHYNIISDGTLKYINDDSDQSARPFISYLYKWNAAVGTAGTWAYHDHNFRTHNGAEDRGLYGALIVNPHSGVTEAKSGGAKRSVAVADIAQENVLYLLDDTFTGMQINNDTNVHSTAGPNPTFTADKNTFVRFHVISLGTNAHKFQLSGYNWIDPGTRDIINMKPIGSLEKHFFTIRTKHSATYSDNTFFGNLLGMEGTFTVN